MKLLLLALLLLITAQKVFAGGKEEEPCYRIRDHYNNENGLPQNSIRAMLMDSAGFLWLTSESQIIRFDGRNFRGFAGEYTAKTNGRISHIYHDQWQPFFRVSDELDFFALPALQSPLARIKKDTDALMIIPINGVQAIQVKGRLYKQLLNMLPETAVNNDKGWNILNADVIDANRCYIKLENKTLFLDVSQNKLAAVNIPAGGFGILTFGDLAIARYYRTNKMIFLLNGKEIPESEAGDISAVRSIITTNKYSNLLTYNTFKDHFLVAGSKAYIVHTSNNKITLELLLELNAAEEITSLWIDKTSNGEIMFAGTNTSGLYVAAKKHITTLLFEKARPTAHALGTVLTLPDGSVLTNQGRFDKNGIGTAYTVGLGPVSYYRSRQGFIYTTTEGYINQFDPDYKKIIRKIPGYFVGMCEDEDGHIYYFNYDGKLLYLKNGEEEPHTRSTNFPEGIIAVAYEGNNCLLIAERKKLHRYNLKTDKIIYTWDGIGSIRAIHIEPDLAFIGTYGNGIYRLKGNDLVKLPMDINKSLAFAHGFCMDKNGFVWIPTNNGLIQVKKQALVDFKPGQNEDVYFYRYSKSDGLLTSEFNGGTQTTYDIDHRNNLFIPSMYGLVKLNLDEIKPIESNANCFIERITQDGTSLEMNTDFKIHSSIDELAFELAAPYYGNESNYLIEYMMVGLEKKWVSINADRRLSFQRLPAGKYELRIRTRSSFSNAYQYQSVSFEVLPVWYKSWWFILAVMILTIAAFVASDKYRTWQKEKMRVSLQSEIKHQSELLDKKFVEIKEKSEALAISRSISDKLESLLFHDLRSPLFFIEKTSKMLTRLINEEKDPDLKLSLDAIAVSAENIRGLSESIVEWIALQNNQLKTIRTSINVKDIIEDAVSFYSGAIESHGNEISISIDQQLCFISDQKLVSAIIRNLIDNANKSMRNGKISISAHRRADVIVICVKDTGPGISEDAIEYINAIMNNRPTDYIKGRYGFGLRIVVDFLKVLDGKIHFQTKDGTIAEIQLPENKN